MKPLGLKGRVMATLMFVAVFAVSTFYFVAARAVRSRDVHVELLELRTEAATLAAKLSSAGTKWRTVPLTSEDDDHRLGIYDPSGRLIDGLGPARADRVVDGAAEHRGDSGRSDQELVAAETVGTGGDILGTLRVSERVAVADAKTDRALRILALFGAALIAASAALGWLLTRSLARRFAHLHRAAIDIGEGDFTARVAPTGLAEFDRIGAALSNTAERVGRLVERERAFSADASHQLRTPIASFRIALETELLVPHADREHVLNEGLAALDRLDATVTSLLDLARDTPTDRNELDVPVLLRRLISRWRNPAGHRGRVLRLLPPDLQDVPIRCSEAAINHVLDVLVDNAIEHGQGLITIQGVAVRRGYAIRVSDQGSFTGNSQSLFHARRRTIPTAGHGIGMGLARTLAAAEGANLDLVSTSPTTFELLLAGPTRTPMQMLGAEASSSPAAPADA